MLQYPNGNMIKIILMITMIVDATSKKNRAHTHTHTITGRTCSSNTKEEFQFDDDKVFHNDNMTQNMTKVTNKGNWTSNSNNSSNKSTTSKSESKNEDQRRQRQRLRRTVQVSSTSFRRIKKEYKDAVDMGIAYDWCKQRIIVGKKKTKKSIIQKSHHYHQKEIVLGPLGNLRHWHFSFIGPGGKEGMYSKGIYHGFIKLPRDYPLSPPDIQMWTPSGRFISFKNICLSASAYHPEAWSPLWSIYGMVNALRMHMLSEPNEIGAKTSNVDETIEFARRSLSWKKTVVIKNGGTTIKGSSRSDLTIIIDHQTLIHQGVLVLPSSLEKNANDDFDNYREEKEEETAEVTRQERSKNQNQIVEEDLENNNNEVRNKEYDDGSNDFKYSMMAEINNNNNNINNNKNCYGGKDTSIKLRLFTTFSSILQVICIFFITRLLLSIFFHGTNN